jgi:simple sugar transport system permease protein
MRWTLLNRPELGAAAGAAFVWVFFAVVAGGSGFLTVSGTATYLEVASELGILAVAVSLLMIGGEFDLSIGSVIAASVMTISFLSTQRGWPLWAAIAAAAALAALVGLLNGLLVVTTRLPSFLVTLGTLFIVGGGTIGATRLLTGRTQLGGIEEVAGYSVAEAMFASRVGGFSISIVWWLGAAALATWVLLRTQFGNWIFGVGGSPAAAESLGVPVARVKVALFVTTALAACLIATFQAVKFTGADVLRGMGKEFEAIIAAVIGGTLLTGGYGSAIGAVFGALIFGMVQQGIVFAGADSDWYKVFLGGMLIVAVLVNDVIRKKAGEPPARAARKP